jgi:hypothetical protein
VKLPWTKKTSPTLDDIIDAARAELHQLKIGTPEYTAVLKQIVELTQLKTTNQGFKVSPDTLALIAANLLGIIIVLKYEQAGIALSKAFGLITKVLK